MPIAVKALLETAPEEWRKPDIIGFHGQTVLHRPQAGVTVQLGDGAALARATGIAVVYDMRANDMRHGGQGAPLVPAYHAALARSLPPQYAGMFPMVVRQHRRHLQHHLCRRSRRSDRLRHRPGNALIDQWVAREGGVPFDADGAIASEGGVVTAGGRALSRQSVLRQERAEIARPQRLHPG